MKFSRTQFFILVVALSGCVAVLLWWLVPPAQKNGETRRGGANPAPVEVVPIERGPIELRRTFSGALEPRAEFIVAPKVSGRVERLSVNIADQVARGQVVGELDNGEYVQAVAQARADLAVTQATLAEARSALETANRELDRVTTLRRRGVASESQLDAVKANQTAKEVELEVARARMTRAESLLETANIRLGYTRIIAGWSGGEEKRVVAERFVDEGETVSANTPLLRIVELDPILGVIFVSERDYARLHSGQQVVLTTDAFPGEEFRGRIERIAPVFKQVTRQARVELIVDNPEQRLKPGMFIRATVVLAREPEAVIIPEQALVRRGDRSGVFLVSADGDSVAWREVSVGIREEGRVQIEGEGVSGRVVTLGQQLLDDGSFITIPAEQGAPGGGNMKAEPR